MIPPEVDAFYWARNCFETCDRGIQRHGGCIRLSGQPGLAVEKLADEEAFLRLATNAIGARPISPALTAIAAPRMRPIHALAHWDCLMAAPDERAATAPSGRTPPGRISLCQGWRPVEAAGIRLLSGFLPGRGPVRSGDRRLLPAGGPLHRRGAADLRAGPAAGHSYQSFYTNGGTNDFRFAAQGALSDIYARICPWRITTLLRRQLLQLADLGFLDQDNCRAAVDLLLRSRLTEATAFA